MAFDDDDTLRAEAEEPEEEEVTYDPHPLFPVDDGGAETKEIAFVTFWRKPLSADGELGDVEHCPQEYPADHFTAWSDVVKHMGGGHYKAVAKDSHRQFSRFGPTKDWEVFAAPSRPWVDLEGSAFPWMPKYPARAAQAATPAPASPPPPTALEVAMTRLAEGQAALTKEMAEQRAELRAMRAAPPSAPAPQTDPAMVAMITGLTGMCSTMMQTAMAARPDQGDTWIKVLHAAKELAGGGGGGGNDLEKMRVMKEIIGPPAPTAQAGEITQIFSGISSLIAADAAAKTAAPPSQAPAAQKKTVTVFLPGVGRAVELVNPPPEILAALAAPPASAPAAPAPAAPAPAAPAPAAPFAPPSPTRAVQAAPPPPSPVQASVPASAAADVLQRMRDDPAFAADVLRGLGAQDTAPAAPVAGPAAVEGPSTAVAAGTPAEAPAAAVNAPVAVVEAPAPVEVPAAVVEVVEAPATVVEAVSAGDVYSLAAGTLAKMRDLPDRQLKDAIGGVPGMDPQIVDGLANALRQMSPEALPVMVRNFPPEAVRHLAEGSAVTAIAA